MNSTTQNEMDINTIPGSAYLLNKALMGEKIGCFQALKQNLEVLVCSRLHAGNEILSAPPNLRAEWLQSIDKTVNSMPESPRSPCEAYGNRLGKKCFLRIALRDRFLWNSQATFERL